MKKLFAFLILLLFFQPLLLAQKEGRQLIDSLQKAFRIANKDTTKLSLLGDIMQVHVYYKPEEGLRYQNQALKLANETNRPTGTAKIKDKLGRLNWRMGNFTEALKNHFEAYDLYEKMGNKYKHYVLVEIGQDYLDYGKYTEAESYLLKCLKLCEEAGDKKTMINAYDVLGYLYNMTGNTSEMTKISYAYLKLSEEIGDKHAVKQSAYITATYFQSIGNTAEALKYFKHGLQAAKQTGDKTEEAYFNMYIGGLYSDEKNFKEAFNHQSEALTLANKSGDLQLLANVHERLGEFYMSQLKEIVALKHFVIALGNYKSIKNMESVAIMYYKIGNAYTTAKQYHLAKKFFDSSKVYYQILNTKLLSMGDYYAGREKLNTATGNWKEAYQNYKDYVVIRDSAFNRESLKKIVSSQIEYENDKKQAVQKAEQEKKDILIKGEIKRQRNILYSSLAVLSVVLLFSGVVYRQRNKIAKEKKRSDLLLLDKELLLREIHHRVKNNLEVVSSLLALQSAQIDDPNTRDAMLAGQNRVHSIGIVHQKLYQGTNLGAIEMKDYFINLSESILDSFGAEKRVTIECAMDQLDVDIDTAVPLGLIVNELLTNTLKYAFPEGQPGKVQIKLHKQPNGALHLEVSDNGVGKSGVTQGTGFGGQLVSLLTQQLSGSMREETSNGTRIYFEFKTIKAA